MGSIRKLFRSIPPSTAEGLSSGKVRRVFSKPNSALLGVGIIGIIGAVGYSRYQKVHQFADTDNYAILFPNAVPGWKMLPKTPESLFVFEDKKDEFLLRGAASQVISEVNPTPELTTDGIAKYYIDRTHENMQTWTAKRSPDLPGGNSDFSVITRQRKDHTVITAFSVKGNTTLMVSISSPRVTPAAVTEAMGQLASFVKLVTLKWADMGGGKKAEEESDGTPG